MNRILALLLVSLSFASAYSQAGELDPAFGNGGLVRSNLFHAGGASGAVKTFLQPNGEYRVILKEGDLLYLTKILPDGTGMQFIPFVYTHSEYDEYVLMNMNYRDAAIGANGKIVLAGFESTNGDEDFRVIVSSADGFIDVDFDGGTHNDDLFGVVTDFGSKKDVATAVAVQQDGRLVVAGYTYVNGLAHFAVVRYLPNGQLDPSFSGDGKQVTSIGNRGAFATDIAVQEDGKIVVAGHAGGSGGRRDFAVVRYNANGSRDLTFSKDGKQLTSVGAYDDVANALAIQSDGKIVLTGSTQTGSNASSSYKFATVRYNGNGSLDTGFNTTGMVVTSIGGLSDKANTIALQPDGRIFIGGTIRNVNKTDFGIVSYTAAGATDNTFNGAGIKTIDFGNGRDSLQAMTLQPDGHIVLTGSTDPIGNSLKEMVVARLNAAGELDTDFSGDGKAAFYYSSGSTVYNRLLVQPDGKIVAAGGTRANFYEDWITRFALARYNEDGSFDASFEDGGKQTSHIPGFGADIRSIALQSDGKIVCGGILEHSFDPEGGGYGFILARYKASGRPDSTFGNDGFVYTSIDEAKDYATLSAVLVQPDGKLVAVGTAEGSFQGQFQPFIAIARYNSDGSPDSSFSGDGEHTILVTNVHEQGEWVAQVAVSGVALQPDGRLIIAGTLQYPPEPGFMIFRILPNGALDRSFSGDGKLITNFGSTPSSESHATTVALQSDGKILVGGDYKGDFAIARFTPGGGMDRSFGRNGKLLTNFGNYESITTLAVQQDGRLLAVGSGAGKGLLARYTSNGTLDSSFSDDGKQVLQSEKGANEINGMAIWNNKLYVSGTSTYDAVDNDYSDEYHLGLVAAYQLGSPGAPVTRSIKMTNDSGLTPNDTAWNSGNVISHLDPGFLRTREPGSAAAIAASAKKFSTNLAEGDAGALEVSAYPNPTSHYFTLQVNSHTNEAVVIQLMDVLGKVIEVRQVALVKGSTVRIGHDLRPGIYYATVTQATKLRSIKLVKK